MSFNTPNQPGSPSPTGTSASRTNPVVAVAVVVGLLALCGGGVALLKSLAEGQQRQCVATLAKVQAAPTRALLDAAKAVCKSVEPASVAAAEHQVAEAEQLAKDVAARPALLASGFQPEQLERASMAAACRQRGCLAVVRLAAQLPGPPRYWECDPTLPYLDAPATPAVCEAKGYDYSTVTDVDGAVAGVCKRKEPAATVGLMRVRADGAYVGAATRAKLERAVQLAASGDRSAFDRYLKAEPGVFVVAPNLEVVLVDVSGVLASMVKVHKNGDPAEFWLLREAIESP
jgi:hypothetical protein